MVAKCTTGTEPRGGVYQDQLHCLLSLRFLSFGTNYICRYIACVCLVCLGLFHQHVRAYQKVFSIWANRLRLSISHSTTTCIPRGEDVQFYSDLSRSLPGISDFTTIHMQKASLTLYGHMVVLGKYWLQMTMWQVSDITNRWLACPVKASWWAQTNTLPLIPIGDQHNSTYLVLITLITLFKVSSHGVI